MINLSMTDSAVIIYLIPMAGKLITYKIVLCHIDLMVILIVHVGDTI
jgi:hypothetical protein